MPKAATGRSSESGRTADLFHFYALLDDLRADRRSIDSNSWTWVLDDPDAFGLDEGF